MRPDFNTRLSRPGPFQLPTESGAVHFARRWGKVGLEPRIPTVIQEAYRTEILQMGRSRDSSCLYQLGCNGEVARLAQPNERPAKRAKRGRQNPRTPAGLFESR